jgi:hypothetical protein
MTSFLRYLDPHFILLMDKMHRDAQEGAASPFSSLVATLYRRTNIVYSADLSELPDSLDQAEMQQKKAAIEQELAEKNERYKALISQPKPSSQEEEGRSDHSSPLSFTTETFTELRSIAKFKYGCGLYQEAFSLLVLLMRHYRPSIQAMDAATQQTYQEARVNVSFGLLACNIMLQRWSMISDSFEALGALISGHQQSASKDRTQSEEDNKNKEYKVWFLHWLFFVAFVSITPSSDRPNELSGESLARLSFSLDFVHSEQLNVLFESETPSEQSHMLMTYYLLLAVLCGMRRKAIMRGALSRSNQLLHALQVSPNMTEGEEGGESKVEADSTENNVAVVLARYVVTCFTSFQFQSASSLLSRLETAFSPDRLSSTLFLLTPLVTNYCMDALKELLFRSICKVYSSFEFGRMMALCQVEREVVEGWLSSLAYEHYNIYIQNDVITLESTHKADMDRRLLEKTNNLNKRVDLLYQNMVRLIQKEK